MLQGSEYLKLRKLIHIIKREVLVLSMFDVNIMKELEDCSRLEMTFLQPALRNYVLKIYITEVEKFRKFTQNFVKL